jgi:dipeptidyl-peptidase-4
MPIIALGRRLVLAVALALSVPSPAVAQKPLTLADIYDPTTRVNFNGAPATGLTWIDATRYAWPKEVGGGIEWTVVDAVDGSARPLFDPARMQAALGPLPGVSEGDARRLARTRALVLNETASAALMTIGDDLYLYEFANDRASRLTSAAGAEEVASFSPDGARVAFVRQNNLHVLEISTGREIPLTDDGAEKSLNGRLDWVYEEEIYGRGERQGYWWSPDSSRIAFLRIDDNPVPTFVVVDDIPYEQAVERWDYPRAGDPNPIVTLGVARVTGGPSHWIDLERYPAADRLVVGVNWPPEGQRLVYEVQNRIQTWLDVNIVDFASGSGTSPSARTLLRESSKAWVNPPENAHPAWLPDGSFLWLSERSGWRHLYHYKSDGTLIRQVTDGRWEVRAFHGVDEGSGWIYFSGTERSHIGRDVYRIRLDGTGMTRLSSARGTHAANFSPTFAYYIDSWSDVTTPTQVRLHRNDGADVRVVSENAVAALSQYRLATPEFLQVATRDGFTMEAMMIKPPDFDPSRRYPVYQFVYGGPQAPQVRNAWGGTQYIYHQLLAQKGIIVWICDNRTASGKGIESAWPVYRNFGELELRDIEDGLAWLKRQPYVDGSRIGIHGWSYGGYMTSYALTHSRSFVMGIAGGTVADWRAYDTVYTERYMGLPEDNVNGYRRSAPRWAAADLHGSLLLIHGTIDDNVHASNALQFAHELQKAQKPFQLMLYPKSRHGITDPDLVKHMRTMMLDFIERHLTPAAPGTAPRTR